jgi:hypothetical protein
LQAGWRDFKEANELAIFIVGSQERARRPPVNDDLGPIFKFFEGVRLTYFLGALNVKIFV